MDNLNDLKAIWLTAKTDSLPDSDEMMRIIKKYRNKTLLKTTVLIVAAIILAALMVVVIFIYKSTMATTRIGELLMIIACLILIATNINSLTRFYKLQDCSNKDFIGFLEQTRLRQLFYYKRTQGVAMAFCSVGLLLYIFEAVYQDTLWCISAYAAMVTYISILWFVVRPRNFKKQTAKLDAMIKNSETLSEQIKSDQDEN